MSAIYAAIQEKIFGSWMTALIISNKEMNDIMKIVKFLEESGLLIKCVTETNKNEAKEQKDGFFGILLGMLGNMLAGKGVIRGGNGVIGAAERVLKVGQDF